MNKLRMNRDVVFTEKPPFPHNMLVELTNICNHKCIFCAHDKMHRRQGMCNKEIMINIIKQAYLAGTREIGFYLTGEPFLNKELEYYVEQCKIMGFEYIYITTNGALVTKDRIKRLSELGLSSIKFSINAATRETYKLIHGKDDFDKVINNLNDILDLKKEEKLNLPIFASFVTVSLNQSEVGLFKQKMGKYFDYINIVDAYNQGGNMPELNNGLIVENSDGGIKAPCSMLFNRLHITYEGYLNACCVDFDNMMAVADLRITPIEEAWNGEKMVKLRREHLSGSIGRNMCYNCINNVDCKEISPISLELYQSNNY
jgi:MoaA/NifB/PqqE/SkfB family radical SAM enzyme